MFKFLWGEQKRVKTCDYLECEKEGLYPGGGSMRFCGDHKWYADAVNRAKLRGPCCNYINRYDGEMCRVSVLAPGSCCSYHATQKVQRPEDLPPHIAERLMTVSAYEKMIANYRARFAETGEITNENEAEAAEILKERERQRNIGWGGVQMEGEAKRVHEAFVESRRAENAARLKSEENRLEQECDSITNKVHHKMIVCSTGSSCEFSLQAEIYSLMNEWISKHDALRKVRKVRG